MKPAVAVMARVPGLVPVKTRMHAALGADLAELVYRCFVLDVLDAVAAAPEVEPVLAFTPAHGRARMAALAPAAFRLIPQEGEGLGERMSNLLAGLIADGHPGAVVIGSDSPTLPMDHVVEAAAALERGAADLVIGPSEDGGYYLIGLRRRQAALFSDIPWSTDRVCELTLERARRLGLRVHQLPEWFDVDTESDLARLAVDLERQPGGPRRTRRFLDAIYV
ncbi:MAG: TIGR04282 family arsenosugar biosynthesis glycosyltransferase [Candidatus Rokuibacteriota bacterium]